jgi:hypothetical protein
MRKRIDKAEQTRAEHVSAAIDQLIHDPDAQPLLLDQEDAATLATARRLAQMPSLLGPVDPILEQQVMRRVRTRAGAGRRVPRFRLGWAITGVLVVLLTVMLLTPLGQTAVASFMAVFELGRTEVRITPVDAPAAPLATVAARGSVLREVLTLEEAQEAVSFAIPQPAYLPAGYGLKEVGGYTFSDLPAWVLQPIFLELVYGDGQGREFSLRTYSINLGDQAGISGLNLQATPIQDVRDVEVNGQPGVLLRLGADGTKTYLLEVVWEQGDLILALSTADLSEAELLRVARSVR